MADPHARNTINILCALLNEHVHNENWLEAIRAYLAILSFKPVLAPEEEAKYRVGLARIRLSHTLDRDAAKKELDRACMLLARKPAHLRLHLEALDQLSRCHALKGDYQLAQETCQRALTLWQHNDDTALRDSAKWWVPYLHLQLAAACPWPRSEGERRQAVEALQQGLQFACAHDLQQQQVLIHLQLAHHALRHPEGPWDASEADGRLRELAAVMLPLQQSPQRSVFVAQATLHFKILQMAVASKKGTLLTDHLGTTTLGEEPPFMVELQHIAATLGPHPQPYNWLPVRAQMAWAYLMAATSLRMKGHQAPAGAYLERGLKEATAELWDMGVADEGGALSRQAFDRQGGDSVDHARALVGLVAQLHLQRAHLHLSEGPHLPAAQTALLAALTILSNFGRTTASILPQAHLMLGLYAHEAGEHASAEAHCDRAIQQEALVYRGPALETQARCLKALAILAGGAPDRAARAADALGDLYPLTHAQEGAGKAEGMSQLVASALTCLAAGQEAEALSRLRRAIKTTLSVIQNTPLVIMIFGTMAPLQLKLKGDWAGARTMLDTASTLIDVTRDLLMKVATARAKLAFEEQCQPRQEAVIAQLRIRLADRERRLAAARQAAAEAQGGVHQALLTWDVVAPPTA